MSKIHSSYLHDILDTGKFKEGLAEAAAQLGEVDFDTIVVTGVSGCIFGGALAVAMDKNLVVVRKENDGSHAGNSSQYRSEGILGQRWVFVDDLICSGATYRRVKDAVKVFRKVLDATDNRLYDEPCVEVGTYTYASGACYLETEDEITRRI